MSTYRRTKRETFEPNTSDDRFLVETDEPMDVQEPTPKKRPARKRATKKVAKVAAKKEMCSVNGNLQDTKDALMDGAAEGAKLAASRRANAMIIGKVRDFLGDSYPGQLDTPFGRAVEPLLIPLIIHYCCVNCTTVPQRDKVQAACEYALTAAFEDTAGAIMDKFLPLADELAKIAPEGEGGGERRD